MTLGNPSTQTLLSTREGIMKTRGRWFDYDTGTRVIRALATFHPAYLLRSPSYKRLSWQDLRAIAKALASSAGIVRCARRGQVSALAATLESAANLSPSTSHGTSCEVQMCTAGLTTGSSSSVATRSTTCG